MQLTAKIKNKSTAHSLLLKPRVGDVVLSAGVYYQNTSGVNSAVSDTNNWIKIFDTNGGGAVPLVVDKTSADVTGTSPNFVIDLSADGLPAFPASIKVYIDLNNDGNYLPADPVNYNPITKALASMNSPVDFPDQKIKIITL
jgi:hypothetical protein